MTKKPPIAALASASPAAPALPCCIGASRASSAGTRPHIAALALLLAASSLLPACAPLVLGGAMVGTALAVSDRRTTGAQLEDQSIELKARSRIREAAGGRGHVNTTSYNRSVLLTGEVSTEEDKLAIERAVAGIDNVRGVVNELAVAGSSSLTSRTSDSLLTSKVKATLIEAKDLQGNVVKVVTERSTVYLMGIVSEREANRATELTRSVSGVVRVVRVFEVVSEAELSGQAAPRK
jgi:osmotically-inducible protein OsmY